MFVLTLAWRYTWARPINVIAVLVVALALTIQITVMGVLDGTLAEMAERVRDLGGQAKVEFLGYGPSAAEVKRLDRVLAGEGVTGLTTEVDYYGIVRHNSLHKAAVVFGVDLERQAAYSRMLSHMKDIKVDPLDPSWTPKEMPSEHPGAFMGLPLAERLGLEVGEEFELITMDPQTGKELRQTFVLGNRYRSGVPSEDQYGVFIPIAVAQRLFLDDVDAKQGGVKSISLWTEDPEAVDEAFADRIRRLIALDLGRSERSIVVTTWKEQWATITQGMKHENALQEVIMALMNIMAGFCVFAIIATLVSRRVRDVGLLRCIGASRKDMILVFLVVGGIVGVVGAILGVAGGCVLATYINEIWEFLTGQKLYPPHMFGVEGGMPVVITAWKIVIYAIAAMIISLLSSLYPALWAGWREPVEALRDE